MHPIDPIQAVTHADPYPYYATLAARPGLTFDAGLKLWIAADAATVRLVLGHPDCLVRPPAEPVPAAIAGAPAGQVFGALVRMNEGAAHTRPKLALRSALGGLDPALARRRAQELGRRMWRDDGVADWMDALPVSVVASLFGFDDDHLPCLAAWMGRFVASLSPLSTPQQLASAHTATLALLDSFTTLLRHARARPDSLLTLVLAEAEAVGWDDAQAVLANLVGLLSQTYEATAGLLGNSVLALLRQPRRRRRGGPLDAAALVATVSRLDPSVQNTRRYVARACEMGGARLEPGQTILVLLAAASRDPAARGQEFGFGHGPHACPGQALASAIATGALEALPPSLPARLAWTYRPSVNARIPVFTTSDAREAA